MNRRKITAALLSLIIALSLASCKAKEPSDTQTTADAQTTDGAYSETEAAKNAYEYVKEQQNTEPELTAADENALKKALSEGGASVLFEPAQQGKFTIKGKNAAEKTLTVKAPASQIECKTALGTVLLAQAAAFSATEHIADFIVSAPECELHLSGGCTRIYIEGKNVKLYLEKGAFNEIYAINTTAVIVNKSGETVNITLANGTKTVLENNKSYSVKTNEITDCG